MTNPVTPESSGKTKAGRACDACRVRKVKCDGQERQGGKCTPCVDGQIACTYKKSAPKRGHSKRFVLEKRTTKMEEYLRSFMPHDEFEREFSEDAWSVPLKSKGNSLQEGASTTLGPLISAVEDDDDSQLKGLNDSFALLSTSTGTRAGFGKASRTVLAQEAWRIRQPTNAGAPPPDLNPSADQYPWERHSPQYSPDGRPLYFFPPPDLFPQLVEIYFRAFNDSIPILHRPTFMSQLASGLHLHDSMFGANVLIVCALGARFSDDPRVFLDEYTSPMTAGWKWFAQVDIAHTVIHRPTLFDVQFYCLTTQFLYGTSNSQSCWILSGMGIRLAQEAGADRRTGRPPSVVDEQWKRAWWTLVIVDRMVSETLGRAPAVNDENMTQVLPVDCDDEYWETLDPTKAFKQPPGKPSKVAGFIQAIGLARLLGIALRTIFCIHRKRLPPGLNTVPEWESQVVVELNTALKSWLDKLPPHLQRANNNHVGDLFFRQSVGLHCAFYSIMINIRRPFLDLSGKQSPLSSSYLDVCVDAARSCATLLNEASKRIPGTNEYIDGSTFTCGVLLLLHQWLQPQEGLETEITDMENVQCCIDFLEQRSARRATTASYAKQLRQLRSNTPQNLEKTSAAEFQLPSFFSTQANSQQQDFGSSLEAATSHAQSYPTLQSDLYSPPYFPNNTLGGPGHAFQGGGNGFPSYDMHNWGGYMELMNGHYFDALE